MSLAFIEIRATFQKKDLALEEDLNFKKGLSRWKQILPASISTPNYNSYLYPLDIWLYFFVQSVVQGDKCMAPHF